MARVTIEDCLEKVDDRFELVALAAQRAKDIASGAEITIERKGEKDTVIALREIADENIDTSVLRTEIVESYQKERDVLESFISPSNNNDDSISIEEEEADIRAAIADATEAGIDNEEDNAAFAAQMPAFDDEAEGAADLSSEEQDLDSEEE